MHPYFDDDDESVSDEHRERVLQTVAVLQERGAALEDPLRKLGVYMESAVPAASELGPVLVIDAMVGDVALSTRVQNPGQAATDDVSRQMDRQLAAQEAAEAEAEIKRWIEGQ